MGHLFVYVDWFPLAHAASRFSAKGNITKKRTREKEYKKE